MQFGVAGGAASRIQLQHRHLVDWMGLYFNVLDAGADATFSKRKDNRGER
jgi:hypothetical protein